MLQNTKNAFEHDWRAMLDDNVIVHCKGPEQYIPLCRNLSGNRCIPVVVGLVSEMCLRQMLTFQPRRLD